MNVDDDGYSKWADHEWIVDGANVMARWEGAGGVWHRLIASCTGVDIAQHLADEHNRGRAQ